MELPACGIYRTTAPIAGIGPDRLVYFHNHGDPGPGLYLPERWQVNRAEFANRGYTLEVAEQATTLFSLPPEGLYRVREPFVCCEKRCRTFAEETLLQLGYNGAGRPIVFVPDWREHGLGFPESGQAIDDRCLRALVRLGVQKAARPTQPRPEHFH